VARRSLNQWDVTKEGGSRKAVCDRSGVHVRLLRLFASPSYQPPVLPAVALEILQLARRPDATFDELVSVLEHDSLLAAKVLSIAQSALYAPRSPILSLKHATVRLGMKTIRDLVLEAALHLRVFRVPGYDAAMERLAWHSTVTAYIMRALCRKTAIETEYAFACGLLHDVGIAACLLALSDDARGETVPFEALGTVLDDVHEEASGLVTRLWGLPADIQRVLATHHHLEVGGTPHPVNAALIASEHFASELDAGAAPAGTGGAAGERALDSNPPELFEAACAALGLDGCRVEAARAEARQIVTALSCPAPGIPAAAS
jgi:HD-like signal output (HDOD) protein